MTATAACYIVAVTVTTIVVVTVTEVRGHTKVLKPYKDPKYYNNQHSAGMYDAFPPKRHETTKVHKTNKIILQTELTWPWVSTQLQCRVPPFPHQLVTTDYSGYYLECCLHHTKRTVVVSTGRNTPAA